MNRVHGLIQILRWNSTDSVHLTIRNGPTEFSAYKLFMNEVNQFDQLYDSHTTEKREHQVAIFIFPLF